ncbi:MAG: terpene cyclase/mutase family protein [Tepidisphaeraceae bacterium]
MIRRTIVAVLALSVGVTSLPVSRAEEPTQQVEVRVDDATADTIEAALRYLAARQRDDGSWSTTNDDHVVALTAYAVHAFLAAGHVPGRGPHAKTLDRAVDYLLSSQRESGYLAAARGQSNMYGHGIATIVLGELYGQTQDERVRPVLKKAVDCIIGAER